MRRPPLLELPHHDGSSLHVEPATPALGEPVLLRLRVPDALRGVTGVQLRVLLDHEPRFVECRPAGRTPGWTWWEAAIPAENPVVKYRWLVLLDDGHLWITSAGPSTLETRDADDFRLAAGTDVPDWAASAVLYQVFPDRFARSVGADEREAPDWAVPAAWDEPVIGRGSAAGTQLYGGDLDGIRERLGHLERLGVNLLYLTPFFPAGSNHRYDAASFDTVDPILGGDDALVRLVEAAHERGIRVMGDLTTNHCGDRHEWFRAAHTTPGAPESDFFYWLDEEQQHYVSWLGFGSLPKLNWHSPELRRRFVEGADSVVARWLEPPFSLDGWRIDVANMTGRHADDDLNADVRRAVRRTMRDVEPETLLLGEYTGDAAEDFQGDAWHGAMTYPGFTRPVWEWLSEPRSAAPSYFGMPYPTIPDRTGADLYQTYRRFTAAFPWPTRLASMNALDTHDVPRLATYAREGAIGVGFGLSVALPGIPVVWAGDELALTGLEGESSRTPMPWDTLEEHRDTIDLYAELIRLRRGSPALQSGGLRWLAVTDDALAFVRETAEESVLVLAARADVELELPYWSCPGVPVRLVGDATAIPTAGGSFRLASGGIGFTAWRLPGVALPEAILEEEPPEVPPLDAAG